jgi:hypothetical protein
LPVDRLPPPPPQPRLGDDGRDDTNLRDDALERVDAEVDLETFYAQAPRMNPNARLIDRLIDEPANGKKMTSILRK